MRESKYILIFMVIATIILILSSLKEVHIKEERKIITATTTFTGDLVRQIAKDNFKLNIIMGENVDPHLYKARAKDIDKFLQAHLIIYGGLHLEGKLSEILEELKAKGKNIIAVSDEIPSEKLILASKEMSDEGSGVYDPHIWFDIDLWRHASKKTAQAIIKLDLENESFYRKNLEKYLKELENLKLYVEKKLEELDENKRYLITAHDAFSYFGRSNGIKVYGLQGINTLNEPGTGSFKKLADFIVAKKVKAIFLEPTIAPKKLEALREAVLHRGWNVEIGGELFSDSLGNLNENEGTYIGMYKHNINTIVDALK